MSEKKTSQFLPSLYQMCNNDDTTHRTCINWSDDHKSFWVSNIETFSRMILPMYFKHNNYASFVRQLNMYGFHRSTEPRGKAVPGAAMVEHFTHPYFVKGRDDLLQNIHRKTSSGFKGAQKRSGAGKATAAAGGGIVSSKETRHMQQMLMDHDEKIGQVVADVDVLKRNQMQLANTLQAMHAQSVSMQTELAMNAERLEQLVQALAMHNVVIEDGHDDRRQREAAREQAVLEQQSHMQHLMQPPPEITPLDAASTTHAASGFDPEYEGLSPRFDEDEDGISSEAQGMEFDSLFAQMDGDMAFDPLY